MRCKKCGVENPETKQFCGDCGTPLPLPGGQSPAQTETFQTSLKELTTGSTFAGRYQVIEELGRGGMGRVYKAFDSKVKEKVALKLIRPEVASDRDTIERFSNELRLARRIRHKNVCGMFDIGEAEGSRFITMEYVHGEDLKSMIRMSGSLSLGMLLAVGKQVCEGLSEAHGLGVVHRDLKPQNIMIDRNGNAKIMDFGIARSVREKGITGPSVMVGTPEYMSPEQAEAKDVDARSDIYSLGVILYEMATSRVPFEGDTALSVAMKHKGEAPKNPKQLNPSLPDDLAGVILKCLEKEKSKRYQSASALAADLDRIEKGLPTAERVVPERKPLTSREITVKFNLKKALIPAAAVVAAAAVILVIIKLIPRKATAPGPRIENSIAVISFKNLTGDPAYDYLQEAIPNLLITNLQNTGLFYVASWERMQDIVRQMGVRTSALIDSDLGFEICRRDGIGAIAIGSFTRAGDVFRTDMKVLDSESKRLLKSVNTRGGGVESILASQIDILSREMSFGLGVDKAKVESAPFKVQEITTTSLRAYDHFLKGKEAYSLVDWETARNNLRAALEIDADFTMAYVYLAWVHHNSGDIQARDETITRAMALSDRSSQKDRLFLEAAYALFIKQDYDRHLTLLKELTQKFPDEKWAFHYLGDCLIQDRYDAAAAREQYEKWLALDPRDFNAISHLISACAFMGDFKKAEDFIKMHDAVAPPDAYFLLVQSAAYMFMGKLDLALAKNKESLKMRPDFSYALMSLTAIYAMREEFEESLRWADEYVARAATPGLKSDAHGLRGFLRYWRGSYVEALSDFDLAGTTAQEAGNWVARANALEGKGVVYLARGDYALSRAAFDQALEILVERVRTWIPYHKAYLAWRLGLLAVEQGQTGAAQARLSEMRTALAAIEGGGKTIITKLADLLEGEALQAKGDLDRALAVGMKAGKPLSPVWTFGTVWHNLGLSEPYADLTARILARKGNTAEAIAEYERLLKPSGTDERFLFVNPLFHYRLGLLYERAGDFVKARPQYRKFLELWKDADPGTPEVEDARKRLAALGT